jgi:methylase of polypeptide subunit release factors
MADPVAAMADRVLETVLGGLECLSIALGDRLGLYRALAAAPGTAADVATRLHLSERWTREWLEQHAVIGYLVEDDGAFSLAPGVAETLAQPEAPTTMAPLARIIAAAGLQLDEIEAAARTGRGHPWSSFGREMRDGQAMINKPALLHDLPTAWLLAALPHIVGRLADGARLTGADIGCGGAWSSIGLARIYPSLTMHGYDVDAATVLLAERNVAAADLADRVTIRDWDLARHPPDTAYDFALAVECIHDMPDPVGVLAGVRSALAPGASLLVIDEKVADSFTAPGDIIERLMYGHSTLVCLIDSMSTPGSVATGTVMRSSTMTAYAEAAGFTRTRIADVEHEVFRFYVLETV